MQKTIQECIRESLDLLHELNKGASYDGDKQFLSQPEHFSADQEELFPDLPSDFTRDGNLDARLSVASQPLRNETRYVVFDGQRRVAYADVTSADIIVQIDQGAVSLQVGGLFVNPEYRGQQIALKLYHWLLTHKAKYLVADVSQSDAGAGVWKQMLMSKKFALYYEDWRRANAPATKRIRTKTQFDAAYKHDDNIMFATLDDTKMPVEKHDVAMRHELVRLATRGRPDLVKKAWAKIDTMSDAEIATMIKSYNTPRDPKDYR